MDERSHKAYFRPVVCYFFFFWNSDSFLWVLTAVQSISPIGVRIQNRGLRFLTVRLTLAGMLPCPCPDYASFSLDMLGRTPAFVINREALRSNLMRLGEVQERSGASILFALKAFAQPQLLPLFAETLSGATASGLNEALLAFETFGGKPVHVYSPAFKEQELEQLVQFAHTIVFNTPAQHRRLRGIIDQSERHIDVGLRINPGHSETAVPLYDPCAKGSRLGYPVEALNESDLIGLDGLHFHTLCEQDFGALERTLAVFEQRLGRLLDRLSWLNFGGGHLITADGYDRDALCECLREWSGRRGLRIYLEPGETAVTRTGVLVGEVLDTFDSRGIRVAVLDVSATAHMPDTLEMPYRPEIVGAADPGILAHTYRLGGPTCLAGDVIGDYSFEHPLEVGQRLVFLDMSHYTMVKTTTFNGVQHPDIHVYDPDSGELECLKRFRYLDFKQRLG